MARGVDHLVLPVPSLDIARARYEALGFSVNKDGVHPFGTANCCIFIENGVYLEPLAIHDKAMVLEKQMVNSFVALDQRFRHAKGDNGLSALSLQTSNAQDDHVSFAGAYDSGPSPLKFSRKALNPDGSEDTLSVDGAFCMHPDFPALNLFTCEWQGDPRVVARIKNAPTHANTVTATIGVDLEAGDMEAALAYLSHGFGEPFQPIGEGRYQLQTHNCLVTLARGDDTLCARAITFQVASMDAIVQCLRNSSIDFEQTDEYVSVTSAPGQGVTMRFTQRTSLS